MSMKDLEEGFCLIEKNFTKEERIFSSPKSKENLNYAESLLGIKFPYTYRSFIANWGFGGVGSFIISGIRSNKKEEILETGVVWLNLLRREKFHFPSFLLAIYDVGEGTSYCLDTSQMNSEGECPVVAWPLGGYETTPILEIIAEDFGKFFLDMVQLEISCKEEEA